MTQNNNDNLPTTTKTSKSEQLRGYLFTEPDIKAAAIKAGYAESTASKSIYTMIKQPEFQNRLRQYAIQNDLLSLPQLAKIESKCLKLVEDSPEKYPKFKEIFRQKKTDSWSTGPRCSAGAAHNQH